MNQVEVANALQTKGASNACMSCGHNNWGIHEKQTLLSEFDAGNFDIGTGIPAVLMICHHCGFIRMHAALVLGV